LKVDPRCLKADLGFGPSPQRFHDLVDVDRLAEGAR
jgi:hypothetical protein